MKKTVILLAALLMLLSFASCSGTIKSSEAKEQIRNYFDAVEEKNYALADTFLHPDSAIESESVVMSVDSISPILYSESRWIFIASFVGAKQV